MIKQLFDGTIDICQQVTYKTHLEVFGKRKTNQEHDQFIYDTSLKYPKQGAPTAQHDINQQQPEVSTSTIRRRMKEFGAWFGRPTVQPEVSENNRKRKLQWAKDHKQHDWWKTIFSDEKYFVLGKENGRIWCFPSCDNARRSKKGRASLHIWGAISSKGKSELVIIKNTMNRWKYINIMDNNMMNFYHYCAQEGVWYYQQDGAKPHTAHDTIDYFHRKRVKLLQWPAQSSDINPIENLWSIMQRRVELQRPKNKQDLIDTVFDQWTQIQQETIDTLINSMPDRINECIENDDK